VKLFTFWSFAPVTYIERLCLTSMVAAGHAVDFYTFDENVEVPGGVTVRDAGEILPRERVIFYRDGSPALFANLFRYEGVRRGIGTWIDADMLVLRSIGDLGAHIFGWEDDASINNAVLKLPADSPFFAYVDRLTTARVPLPAHWPLGKKLEQIARGFLGRQHDLPRLGWGVTGPRSLTHFVRENGLAGHAQPTDVFYPVHWYDAGALFDPAARVEDRITARTRTVHLWNSQMREQKRKPPPRGSFIARMCAHYGVDAERRLYGPDSLHRAALRGAA
jgi:hypothetical protein